MFIETHKPASLHAITESFMKTCTCGHELCLELQKIGKGKAIEMHQVLEVCLACRIKLVCVAG